MLVGDQRGLAELFRTYYSVLYDYGCKLVAREEMTEDAIQETFATLWEKRHHLTTAQSVRAYLFATLKRSLLRQVQRQRLLNQKTLAAGDDYPDHAFSPEDMMLAAEQQAEQREAVISALRQIPTRQREALYLKTFSALKYREIATIMNISQQVARNYVSEAYRKLRELL